MGRKKNTQPTEPKVTEALEPKAEKQEKKLHPHIGKCIDGKFIPNDPGNKDYIALMSEYAPE